MDYLEKLYISELNSPDNSRVQLKEEKFLEGNSERRIEIDGATFVPSEILSGDPEAYKESFILWKEERKESSLSKAKEILDLYDNRQRFEKIFKIHSTGNLIPFIGAGMSMPSNYPSWSEYLIQLSKETEINENDIKKLLNEGEYEQAAELLSEDLTPQLFNEKLENTFSDENEIIGAIQYLPFLFSSQFTITTNFDNVLERIFNENDLQFEDIKSGRYLKESSKRLVDGTRYLIKLHGTCNQVMDRVLTKKEYDEFYLKDNSLYKFIKRAMISKSLLFMGCSLNHDRLIATMIKIAKEEGHDEIPKHYALLADIEEEKTRKARQKFLAEANIFPIWYSGEDDEAIEALFVKILNH